MSEFIGGTPASVIRENLSEKSNEMRRKNSQLQSQLKDYRSEHGKLQVFFDELGSTIPIIAPNPTIYTPTKLKSPVGSAITPVLCHNDTHMGAVQTADEIEGFNAFSPEILESRVMGATASFLDWVYLHRSNYKINEMTVLCLGDLISGDIHDELKITNEFPAPMQCTRAGTLLANMIATLAPHFTKLNVEFIVEDNHARLTKKPQAKEAGINSFNYVVGYIAKTMLSSHTNVQFNMYPQYEAVVTVNNRRYLCTHGHGVMGWMGFPYYGVERRIAREALKRMNGPDLRKFHRVIMGHWHSPLSHQWYWISGSASGTDAYDHKNGRYAPPSQAAWMVHPQHGEFDRTDFNM